MEKHRHNRGDSKEKHQVDLGDAYLDELSTPSHVQCVLFPELSQVFAAESTNGSSGRAWRDYLYAFEFEDNGPKTIYARVDGCSLLFVVRKIAAESQ